MLAQQFYVLLTVFPECVTQCSELKYMYILYTLLSYAHVVCISNSHVKYSSKIQLFHEFHILYNYTVLQNHTLLPRPLVCLEFGISFQGNGTGF